MRRAIFRMVEAGLLLCLAACNSKDDDSRNQSGPVGDAALEGGGVYPTDISSPQEKDSDTASEKMLVGPKGTPGVGAGSAKRQKAAGDQNENTAARAGATSSASGSPGSDGNSNASQD